MVGVYALRLNDNLNDAAYQHLIKRTSLERRQRYVEYRNKQDAYRSLLAEFLARYRAMQRLNVSNKELTLGYSSYGKPYFIGFPNPHFNLSHSGDWVVVAESANPVGIDIEEVLPLDLDSMASMLSIAERQDFVQQPAELQLAYFYELFTLKESFVKQTGEGLSRELDTFTLKLLDGNITIESSEQLRLNVFFKQFDLGLNYKMAACSISPNFSEVTLVSLSEVLGAF